jgi:hypothetical protein
MYHQNKLAIMQAPANWVKKEPKKVIKHDFLFVFF